MQEGSESYTGCFLCSHTVAALSMTMAAIPHCIIVWNVFGNTCSWTFQAVNELVDLSMSVHE